MTDTIPIPKDIPLPLPAPEPLLVLVLVVSFLLHLIFVNFMVGGALLTLYYEIKGLKDRRYDNLAHKIAATITANKSLAVVLGVGPLLAINTLYTVYFYTANALTGTFWISIVPLVAIAFLLTYAHKYWWERMARAKGLHIAICAATCLLFLFIPLIFLTNINLMLFPDKWPGVRGFLSAMTIGNVFPRYAHFLLACLALTGLFLVWLFKRTDQSEIAAMGFDRATLIRLGYLWAFWPTAAQFVVGPLVLLTLPNTPGSIASALGAIGIGVLAVFAMLALMASELRRPPETIGKRFVAIAVLMLVILSMMGTGRHLYREAAVSDHRKLVEQKTQQYMRDVEAAKKPAPVDGRQP